MSTDHLAKLTRSLAASGSRRGVLAALSGGLLTERLFALGRDETAAKQNDRRKRRRKQQARRKKRRKQQDSPPPPPPEPAVRLDATCPLITGGSGILSSNGNVRFAQTFTALASGPLVRAELAIRKAAGSSGDYILRLSPVDGAGVPTNAVLAETSVANSAVADGSSTVTFSFASPAAVTAGTAYALVLTRPGATSLFWEGQPGESCPGGAFDSDDQTAPFEPAEIDIDLIFATFVSS